MNSIKRHLLALTALVLSMNAPLGFAQQNTDSAIGTVTSPTGEEYKAPKAVPKTITRITFYRPANSNGAGVTGLQVNGHHHTSLQLGTYSDLCMSAPSKAEVTARFVETGKAVKTYVDAVANVSLKGGQQTFMRVVDQGNGRAFIKEVDASVAKADLKHTHRQIHAVSRVADAVDCDPSAPKQTQAVETITLAADALFGFGKSDINAISPAGRESLDDLIARLQKSYGKFDATQLQVIGYADPLGNPVSNKHLSAARADTIKNYMVNGGIASNKISSEGRGDKELVVSNCAKTATPESIQCNKPNRRVIVRVNKLQNR
jgi:OOP family OmpA-OmpF porin